MGKAFSQYPAERMPYSASEISYCLIRYAKNYINGEHKNISGIDSKIRDAVLVDVINHIAIMGCVVNGPGEAKDADIGIAGGINEAVLFKKGQIIRKIKQEDLVKELNNEIDKYVKEKAL